MTDADAPVDAREDVKPDLAGEEPWDDPIPQESDGEADVGTTSDSGGAGDGGDDE